MEEFFVSYTRADEAWAQWIAWSIEEIPGFKAIFAPWDFPPGSNFVLQMHESLKKAEGTILVLSPDYLNALYTQPEWAAAFARASAGNDSRVIPLRVRACEPDGLLRALIFLDLMGLDEQTAIQALLRVLRKSRGKPISKPPYPGPKSHRPKYPGSPAEVPPPLYMNDETRQFSLDLEIAYQQKEELGAKGVDTNAIQGKILDLRRRIREGGQLKAGDFLLEGRFRLIAQIGRGGFATVWKAWDRKKHTLVAVKVLHVDLTQDRSYRERFFRGARKMRELQHQGIVRVIEERIEDGGYYAFAMEYVDGGDLHEAVLSGHLSIEERLRIILEVGKALSFAHENGTIHRDVKPANILLGNSSGPKLTDFDLVRALDTTGGTRTGMLGTYMYAAPEAFSKAKDVDRPADIYGLGMTTLFTLRGEELPDDAFRDATRFVRSIHLPEKIEAVFLQALAIRPEYRFSTVHAFCDSLRECIIDPNDLVKSFDSRRNPAATSTPNKKYEFKNFFVANFNHFAHSSAVAVAENYSVTYNPLFICGETGSGKSHLLHAIGNRMQELNPARIIIISSAEEFVNHLIISIRDGRMIEFRELYRNTDVLLIDDVDFIANKERSQEELFHTLTSLQRNQKQIILTSCHPPRSIDNLETRLRTQFEGGLITNIESPSLEEKTSLIAQIGQSEDLLLPSGVTNFIASRTGSNIRELRGILNRLIAASLLKGKKIDLEFSQRILEEILPRKQSPDSGRVIKRVASHFDLKMSEIKSASNIRQVAYPRQVAMYLCKKLTPLSFPEIGAVFSKHHSTVMYSVDKIQKQRLTDPALDNLLSIIEKEFQ